MLTNLPDSIRDLRHLSSLNLGQNTLTEFPNAVLEIPVLKCLNMTGCSLEEFPNEKNDNVWKNVGNLRSLILRDNSIKSLPDENLFSRMKKLELLDLSANFLQTFVIQSLIIFNYTSCNCDFKKVEQIIPD